MKIISYAGLNPSISQSGDKCYIGHISKQGNNNLRWILVECANIAIMQDSIATARKVLTIIYAMLMSNRNYIPQKKCKAS